MEYTMKLYLIYAKIKTKEFDAKLKYLIGLVKNDSFGFRYAKTNKRYNYYIGLYAWTTNKKLLKEFLIFHKAKHFVIKKKCVDAKEMESFKKKYKDKKLSRRRLYHNIGGVLNPGQYGKDMYTEIVLTRFEYVNCSEELETNAYEFCYPHCATVDYRLFKDKWQRILDLLNYTLHYDLNQFDNTDNVTDKRLEDYENRKEVAEYNLQFGLTPMGNQIKLPVLFNNEYAMFIRLYSYFLL